jgi:hypothetical protein
MAPFRRRRTHGHATGAGRAARRGRWGVARVVGLITAVLVGLIVVGILLVLLEANRSNEVVGWILDAGEFVVEPFDNIFKLDSRKANVAVNWGLGALIYALIGGLLVRLLAR